MAAGIYIHIPFCVKKCLYCDFVSNVGNEEQMKKYQKALLSEMDLTAIDEKVDSVFLGGGTPSVYPVDYVEEIMDRILRRYPLDKEHAEITIECNPGTVTFEKLKRYRESGINRISFGLQSANNDELKTLGRIHTYEEFEQSYRMAREAGFDNINVDIMSAIPKQSFDSYKETLCMVAELEPEHISSYSLIVEEGTPFYHRYGEGSEGEKELPDEDTDREMYHFTKEFLGQNGYDRYEISNYAKEKKECRHNLKYWNRDNYYGFGVAAASLVDNKRYVNVSNINTYIENKGNVSLMRASTELIEVKEQMEEYMFLGLRKMKGISAKDFEHTFHVDIHNVYGGVLEKMCKNDLMQYNNGYYCLSDRGIDVSNVVLAEFL